MCFFCNYFIQCSFSTFIFSLLTIRNWCYYSLAFHLQIFFSSFLGFSFYFPSFLSLSQIFFFLFGIFIFIFLMRLDVPSWLTFFNVLTQPGVVKAHKECFPIVGSMIFFFSNAIRIFWLSMIRSTFFHPCHEWYWWDDENVLLFRYENFYSKTAW